MKMKNYRLFVVMLALLACLGLAGSAAADGIIIIDPPPDIPPIRLDEALTIKYHRVTVTIEDQVATTHVDQVFLNENHWVAEGTYVFPLPEGAAVSEFVMWVDGVPITGEILEADEARRIYNDIVNRMRDPALLEYVGRDMLKASIFPIPPGEERRVELEYSQVLPVDNGLIHYVYPLSTERYSARPLEEVSIRVEIDSQDAIKAVYSPSHQVFIERPDDYRALVGLEQYDVRPDKDFELYYSISPEDVGLNLLSFKEAGQDGFFLLLAAPNVSVDPGEAVAKDVIFVLDVSGSMEGEKVEQARNAALYILEHLNPQDRFNVIAFSTGLRSYARGLQPASEWDEAADFVERLEALGGTDINRALLEALEMADRERPTTLIFLTDGLATEGVVETPRILDNVEMEAGRNVRLFSFGVGDDVDTDLLDALALDHGGTSAYVRPGQRLDEEVSAFYAKVSTPVLADIELDFGDMAVDRLYPATTPDLFAGTQLVLVGRYWEGGPATITLSGVVNGERVSFSYPDQYFRNSGGDDFIPRLWATRAIGHYLTQIRLYGENAEWVETIVNLSLRYGIITPYTSFLIDEDDIFTQTGRQNIVEEAEEAMAADAAAPAYGAEAVESAAGEGALREAEAPLAVPTMVAAAPDGSGTVQVTEVMKYVGSKTFVLRDGAWVDTAFDPSVMDPVQVGFLSDDYFELVAAVPALGDYFALGERVVAVHEGVAYQVGEGAGEEVVIPTPVLIDEPEGPTPDSGRPADPTAVAAVPEATSEAGGAEVDEGEEGSSGLCLGALVLPTLLGVVALVAAGRKSGYTGRI
jgi:Ca-activated chloride channel family protein